MIDRKNARTDLVNRDTILMMLSDDETGSVCTAETAAQLPTGSIFIDLDHLDRGVQTAPATGEDMGGVLPKTAVHATTWKKIEAVLAK